MSDDRGARHHGLRGWMERSWRVIGAVVMPLVTVQHLFRYLRFRAEGEHAMAAPVLMMTIAMAVFSVAWWLLLYIDWRLHAQRPRAQMDGRGELGDEESAEL